MAPGTPATSLLTEHGIVFATHTYVHDARASAGRFGDEAANALGVNPHRIFKTLIATVDARLYCAVVPVADHLDLKALARAAGGKKAAMADAATAQRATGYVLGGISPLGQRTAMPVFVDASVEGFDTIYFSGGRRGLQIELAPADLIALLDAVIASLAGR